MSWRQAFLRQARSEQEVRRRLNDAQVEYSHRLHYLQMVTEKLAKGLQADDGDADPPQTTHSAFVSLLQAFKGRRSVRKQLGFKDAASFRKFIASILDLADRVERLAPAAAGLTQPNPEYPWRDPSSGLVVAPVDHAFVLFNPRDPKMIKLESLLEQLLRIAR